MSPINKEVNNKVLYLGDDINTDDIMPANRATTYDADILKQYALEHLIGVGELLKYNVIVADRKSVV